MRALLQRLWRLPWPNWFRRLSSDVVTAPLLRVIFFPRFAVGVVGLIENDRGELLLLRHTYRSTYPWGLPTGFLEHGEQPIDALHREIREETGFEVELDPRLALYTEPDRALLNVIFRGRYLGGSFCQSAEISDARFFREEDMPDLQPGQRHAIARHRRVPA